MKKNFKKDGDFKMVIIAAIVVVVTAIIVFVVLRPPGRGEKPKRPEKPEVKEVVSNIELGKEQYIEQLKNVPINGTSDYLIITEKRAWVVPEHESGTTVSFTIAIPYILHVDGVDYSGTYNLNYDNSNKDDNPKYTFSVENLTSNGDISVLFKNK